MLAEKFTNTTSFSRNAVISALVLIAAIAGYNWLISPHTGSLLAADRYEEVANTLAKKNRVIASDVAIRKTELEKIQTEFEQIRSELFTPQEAKEFFNRIQSIADEKKCILQSLDFSAPDAKLADTQIKPDLTVTANIAQLTVSGSYNNILAFIDTLQDASKRLTIDSLSIKLPDKNTTGLKCEFKIKFYVIEKMESVSNEN